MVSISEDFEYFIRLYTFQRIVLCASYNIVAYGNALSAIIIFGRIVQGCPVCTTNNNYYELRDK